MKDENQTAFDNYYKLKAQYEATLQRKKLLIIRDKDLSKKEKKQKFKRLKSKCINCKRNGGTIFSNTNRTLKAVCGHSANPCKLNFEITKGEYMSMAYLNDLFRDIIEDTQLDIIKNKLNFLFGYIDEEETVEQFNHYKDELKSDTQTYLFNNQNYLSIVKNKANQIDEKDTRIQLFVVIERFKAIIKEYKEQNAINDAVELYISSIQPTAERLRNIKYVYNTVEYNPDTEIHTLIQEPYTLSQLETHVGVETVVVANRIN